MWRYIAWAQEQISEGCSNPEHSEHFALSEMQILKTQKPSWGHVLELTGHIAAAIRGETDAHSLLVSSQSISSGDDFWSEAWHRSFAPELDCFLTLSAHETANQKILHLSAGTWGLASHTTTVLQQVESRKSSPAFSSYIFGNTSTIFFEHARKQFTEISRDDRITAVLMDRSVELCQQLSQAGPYDKVFIEQSYLLAVEDAISTIQAIGRVLKVGGHLIIAHNFGSVNFQFIHDATLGVLPDW
ncbi:hypothetical protein F5B17DRAFT_152381 [Nemania serpens]|nr:hypothetical protein F5B17DRAFT_152381 [Nemania serpens]